MNLLELLRPTLGDIDHPPVIIAPDGMMVAIVPLRALERDEQIDACRLHERLGRGLLVVV